MTEPLNNLLPNAIQELTAEFFNRTRLGIYLLEQRDAEADSDGRQLLHPNEWQRFQSFISTKRRREYFSGRLACKLALTALQPRSCQQLATLEITNDAQGRPLLLNNATPTEVKVSIAHSADYCLAVATNKLCGVDLQLVKQQLARVQEKFCQPSEQDLLNRELGALPPLVRLGLLWSAKEAARKLFSPWTLPGFLEMRLHHLEKRLDQAWIVQLQVILPERRLLIPFVTALWENYCLSLGILEEDLHA